MEYSSRGRNDANRFGSRRENEDARGGDRDSFGGGGRWDDGQNDRNEVASERYKGKLKGPLISVDFSKLKFRISTRFHPCSRNH